MILDGRTLILSPHLDDAALSLGATIATLNQREGSSATVLTLFAGNQLDLQDAGVWDRRAGFTTAGAASRHRRHEDTQAMHELGANWLRLNHLDGQYRSIRDAYAIASELRMFSSEYDRVIAPGWPLTNADHSWTLLLALQLPEPLFIYAEQPYWAWLGNPVPPPPPIETVSWFSVPLDPDAPRAKLAAIEKYESQLGLLDAEVGEREHEFVNVAALLSALASSGEVLAEVKR